MRLHFEKDSSIYDIELYAPDMEQRTKQLYCPSSLNRYQRFGVLHCPVVDHPDSPDYFVGGGCRFTGLTAGGTATYRSKTA